MLRKITLAAIVALGAAPLAGFAVHPAAAEGVRTSKVSGPGVFERKVYHHRRHWRSHRFHRRAPRARFLARVRHGDVVCYRARHPQYWHRFHGYGHRFYHRRGHRLRYRAVRRLIRHGHGHLLRCFARY